MAVYNQIMSMAPNFRERCMDVSGPKRLNIFDYTSDVSLNSNEPTMVLGRIYNTPGNTPLNTPKGTLMEMSGKFGRPSQFFEYYY